MQPRSKMIQRKALWYNEVMSLISVNDSQTHCVTFLSHHQHMPKEKRGRKPVDSFFAEQGEPIPSYEINQNGVLLGRGHAVTKILATSSSKTELTLTSLNNFQVLMCTRSCGRKGCRL